MNQQPENHIMDIPPHVYTNVVPNNQTGELENGNTEATQQCIINFPASAQHYEMQSPRFDFSAPPPYKYYNSHFVKLPTNEEVQMEKHLEADIYPRVPRRFIGRPLSTGRLPQEIPAQASTVLINDAVPNLSEIENFLGTDYMFLTAFLVAFVFNMVGLLVIMCLYQTVAARLGAMAGIGLSAAKWTIIVKLYNEMSDLPPENSDCTDLKILIGWIVMAFGFFICIRTVIEYMHMKWYVRLLSVPVQEPVLYYVDDLNAD